MNKQSLIKGSLILGLAGIFAKVLGLFFRWPLIMLIGDEGIGLYQMSFPLYMFFVAIASGIPVAISKIVSENNAVGDIEGSFKVVKESTYLMLILGWNYILLILFCRFNNKLFKMGCKSILFTYRYIICATYNFYYDNL